MSNRTTHGVFDPEVGRRAFERLWPRLEALSAEELLPATARVNLAATFVLGVHQALSRSPVKEKIAAMPGLDQELYTELANIAWAAWYAWTKWQNATALQNRVRVSPELLEQRYRADDTEGAQPDAAAMVETLSQAQKDTEDWIDRLTRAWTLLNQAYSEVSGAVLRLERDHANAAHRFPSLYAVARSAAPSAAPTDSKRMAQRLR